MAKRSTRAKASTPPVVSRVQFLWAGGICLVLVGLLTLSSLLFRDAGTLTLAWQRMWKSIVGVGVWALPAVFIGVGLWTCSQATQSPWPWPTLRSIGLAVSLTTGTTLVHHLASPDRTNDPGELGGWIGRVLSEILSSGLGWPGALIVLLLFVFLGLLLLFGIEPDEFVAATVVLVRKIMEGLATLRAWWQAKRQERATQQELPLPESVVPNPVPVPPPPPPALGHSETAPVTAKPAIPAAPPVQPVVTRQVAAHSANAMGTSSADDTQDEPPPKPWVLPNITETLLEADESQMSIEDIRAKTKIIEETLLSLNAPGKVIEVNPGPVVTQFGIEPGYVKRTDRKGNVKQQKIKVAKISSLSNDLALALAASPIRIEAPVPGKGIVGLEVPNKHIGTVRLRGVMESAQFANIATSHLAVALGSDVSGAALVGDLAKLPHLLIAGATGSGKSVCINALIACLLLRNTPDQLRMLMIDPKRVELSVYNGIPHLLAPVVVDAQQVVGVLNWVAREMDQRYREFAKVGARNIASFNSLAVDRGDKPLPFITVFIDELADLMMVAPDDVERAICRIAQMARATGIHLIIATQRPSVDVVTGLIKANFPARISFAVSSAVDSRVIIDTPGADKLLGKGDSLYMAPDSPKLQRMQGCFLSDQEIKQLVEHWRDQTTERPADHRINTGNNESMVQQAFWEDESAEKQEPKDALFARAEALVREQDKASVSMLQRHFRIGYSRAARLIDALEAAGVIGEATGTSKPREVVPEPPPEPDNTATLEPDTGETQPTDSDDEEIPW